ncbi:MAG: tetraacyldisaccharide 4'-kinase [Nitrospinaceae bacterium]
MNLESLYYRIISPQRRMYHVPAYLGLRLLSGLYGWGLCLHRRAFRCGVFPARKLDRRVISVGNLTLGGTGKTPIVMMIAETLRGNGFKPAILSRGYGGRSRKAVNVVHDGQKILLSAEWAGDEPVMMAEKLRNVPVLTGSDRYRTGRYAIDRLGADTLILDDGFQHLALSRDLDILLFDHRQPLGNGRLFPAGELREPPGETQRADLICMTRCHGLSNGPAMDAGILGKIPVIRTALRLDSVIRLDNGEVLDTGILKGRAVAAFCGIARPEDFRRTLEGAKARVVYFFPFPDHHSYSSADLKFVEDHAIKAGAEYILIPEKDAVKLMNPNFSLPAFKVVIEVEILEGREVFNRYLLKGGTQGTPNIHG